MVGFGSNARGRLGFTAATKKCALPTKVPGLVNIKVVDCGLYHSLALDHEGQAWSAGAGFHGELGRHEKEEGFAPVIQQVAFKTITAGNAMSFFTTSSDELWLAGKNLC